MGESFISIENLGYIAIPQTMAISRHQPDSTGGFWHWSTCPSRFHGFSMEILHVFSTDFSHISKGKTPRSTPNPGLEARDGGCAPILGAAHHDCLGAVAARSSDHPTNRWLSRTKSPKIVDFSDMIATWSDSDL